MPTSIEPTLLVLLRHCIYCAAPKCTIATKKGLLVCGSNTRVLALRRASKENYHSGAELFDCLTTHLVCCQWPAPPVIWEIVTKRRGFESSSVTHRWCVAVQHWDRSVAYGAPQPKLAPARRFPRAGEGGGSRSASPPPDGCCSSTPTRLATSCTVPTPEARPLVQCKNYSNELNKGNSPLTGSVACRSNQWCTGVARFSSARGYPQFCHLKPWPVSRETPNKVSLRKVVGQHSIELRTYRNSAHFFCSGGGIE